MSEVGGLRIQWWRYFKEWTFYTFIDYEILL